jgi:hypothetical protein
MAATAVSEQLASELEEMGEAAQHVSPHSLHPTIAATNFFNGRDAKGVASQPTSAFRVGMEAMGGTTSDDIIDGLFSG